MTNVYFYFWEVPNVYSPTSSELHLAPANLGYGQTISNDLAVLNFTYGPLDIPNNVYPTLAAAKAQMLSVELANALIFIGNALGTTATFAGVVDTEEPLQSLFNAKISTYTPGAKITAGATNAANNNATNYNLLSGLLGVANGLNSGNANQNDLADKYNALAGKFNTLVSHLETLGIQAA